MMIGVKGLLVYLGMLYSEYNSIILLIIYIELLLLLLLPPAPLALLCLPLLLLPLPLIFHLRISGVLSGIMPLRSMLLPGSLGI